MTTAEIIIYTIIAGELIGIGWLFWQGYKRSTLNEAFTAFGAKQMTEYLCNAGKRCFTRFFDYGVHYLGTGCSSQLIKGNTQNCIIPSFGR